MSSSSITYTYAIKNLAFSSLALVTIHFQFGTYLSLFSLAFVFICIVAERIGIGSEKKKTSRSRLPLPIALSTTTLGKQAVIHTRTGVSYLALFSVLVP